MFHARLAAHGPPHRSGPGQRGAQRRDYQGVLCIIRVIFYVTGADFLRGTWVQTALIMLALTTVFMGSMMAL